MILWIVEAYVVIGLIFMVTYIVYVGRLISNKYSCSLIEGVSRFERAGSTWSNVKATIMCIATWPKLYVAMKNGVWETTLTTMVEECDY